jgi:predicted ATPase/DNA-binding CsgD family transcriptional regulator
VPRTVARPKRRIGNIPAETTTFVGRRRELAELRSTLAVARLVSLVGPGGVGKTRLAVRIATDLGRAFADGAWWVDLAEVRDPALVANAVVVDLDFRDQSAAQPLRILLSRLQDREMLLVIDNCEHVLDASARLVAELLRVAPKLRVITTSREPLQVPGEHVVPVPPLELPPPPAAQSLSQLRENEAVVLFTERAAAASGGFELNSSNQAAVVDLCRRLDGLPLAIELAAVRTRVLSPEQVLARLDDRFALLTGGGRAALPRQQTLRTTIDWSHDLLAVAEQTLLRRLCVFAGRFTVDDVESVCSFDHGSADWVLDSLAALVDKSLVSKEDLWGIACYRLHETMRDYTSLKLRDAAEEDQLDDAYIEYYRTRFRNLRTDLLHDIQTILHDGTAGGRRTLEWLQSVELEIDNIRAALQKCLMASDWRRGLELATSIGYYWVTRGTTQSIRWFDDLLAAGEESDDIPARAYYFRGWLSMLRSDLAVARPWLARAIAAARATQELPQLSESLSAASIVESMAGDPAAARVLLDEAEAIAPRLDHYPASIALIHARAIHALFGGALAAADGAASEGVRLSRDVGDLYYQEQTLMNLGIVAMAAGDLVRSRARLIEGLRISKAIDNRLGQSSFVRLLGGQAGMSGDPRLAARLLGAAEALGSSAGASATAPIEPQLARARQSVAAALGVAKFEIEYALGMKLDRDSAIRLALGEPDQTDIGAAQPVGAGPLAKREAEVARLIADGLSNKQIGTRLFISERTVATHVRNILNKLGFDSRAQIASWIASPRS